MVPTAGGPHLAFGAFNVPMKAFMPIMDVCVFQAFRQTNAHVQGCFMPLPVGHRGKRPPHETAPTRGKGDNPDTSRPCGSPASVKQSLVRDARLVSNHARQGRAIRTTRSVARTRLRGLPLAGVQTRDNADGRDTLTLQTDGSA